MLQLFDVIASNKRLVLFRLLVTGIIPISALLFFNLNIYLVRFNIENPTNVRLHNLIMRMLVKGLKAARKRMVKSSAITTSAAGNLQRQLL